MVVFIQTHLNVDSNHYHFYYKHKQSDKYLSFEMLLKFVLMTEIFMYD